MDPRNGGDLLCSQEGVYPVSRRGRREGGAGYGCCPREMGGCDPQDPIRVPAGRDDEEEQRGLPEVLAMHIQAIACWQRDTWSQGWCAITSTQTAIGFRGVTGEGLLHGGGGTRTTVGPLSLRRMRAALFLGCRFAPDREAIAFCLLRCCCVAVPCPLTPGE